MCASQFSEGKTRPRKAKLMTTTMKIRGIITTMAIILAGVAKMWAIEGLQISVQCSNVVLSWPSQPGESYIVQYRPDLVPTTQWITLTNYMPPDDGTNITIFVHTNVVQHPNCGTGSSSSAAIFSGETSEPIWASEPLAMRIDGTGVSSQSQFFRRVSSFPITYCTTHRPMNGKVALE